MSPFITAADRARRLLEAQILETLDLEGPTSICRLVDRLYRHVDAASRPDAARDVLVCLVALTHESRVECRQGLPTMRAIYDLRRWRAAA
ncbi:MAG TPA: hypothetical protein VHW60_17365 [Caulobacteraceae bacterium]|jgi:hypothetical protein|nr:hypothetical protein [Caulobacteraceae bacterium]